MACGGLESTPPFLRIDFSNLSKFDEESLRRSVFPSQRSVFASPRLQASDQS